eukprot:3768189-Rhodomonas_salina.4
MLRSKTIGRTVLFTEGSFRPQQRVEKRLISEVELDRGLFVRNEIWQKFCCSLLAVTSPLKRMCWDSASERIARGDIFVPAEFTWKTQVELVGANAAD